MSLDISHLYWRYATKKFDPTQQLSDEQLQALKDTLRLSPSSFGLQTWKFVIVKDPAVRRQLRSAAWDQPQLTDASAVFVLCSRTSVTKDEVDAYLADITQTSGKSLADFSGLSEMIGGFIQGHDQDFLSNWSARQVYIALGMMLATAAQFHIDACPMEGFDAKQFNEILGLIDTGYTATVICPVGFRAADDPAAARAKVRFPEEKVFVTVEIPRK